ncbi:uncharacterized protein LOC132705462 [Cylas formicarius]|uniref:uncharacterized protein LOC132705462 n=1 Tax=Cylas formicarius TaxID=197179 RepID=UPI002958ADE9|nr:uncharacterized protein LOC132705462 [Cylas formicarius]
MRGLKLCCSYKTWAMFNALTNLALGITIIVGGSVWMTGRYDMEFKVYFICGVVLGTFSIIAGCLLVAAIVQGKEILVLRYIVMDFIVKFTLTIFSAMNVYKHFSIATFGILALCPFFWLGLINVYSFYNELHDYNNSAVRVGVDEITCHTNANPLATFPEKSIESTSV